MNTNETRLREALERLSNAINLAGDDFVPAAHHACQVLKETAPEPPKHPAQLAYDHPKCTARDKFSYMQGFKDALLWAAEHPDISLLDREHRILRDTANTVPQ